jgi:hypothetical protein
VAGGLTNTASGVSATVGGGFLNTAGGVHATVPGGSAASASLEGQMAYASGAFGAIGDAQTSLYVLRGTTNGASSTELFLNGSNARLTLAAGQTMTFDILITARTVGAFPAKSAGYHVRGVIENDQGSTTFILPLPTVTTLAEDDAAWSVAVTADDTHDALVITVTGTGTLIRWVALVRTAEVAE